MRVWRRISTAAAPGLVFAVALLATLPAAVPSAALMITSFSDGDSSELIAFGAGGGTDNSAAVAVPKDSYEVSTQLLIRSGSDASGNYPWNPAVYANSVSNGTQVYGYSGPAYGAMGLQTLVSNNSATGADQSKIIFTVASTDSTTTFKIPSGSNVLAAQLTLTGAPIDLGFAGPDTVNTQSGANNIQINTQQRGAPYLVDIDADGDLDLFAAGGNFSSFNDPYAGGPRFFRNTGNATAFHFQENASVLRRVQQGYGFNPALADLDGDGDFDLLTMGGYYGSYVRFYWNTGDKNTPNWTLNNSVFSGFTVDAFARPTFADLDGDGDFDLIIGDETGALTYFRNSGTKSAPSWTSSNLFAGINVGQTAAPAFGDYDGDGDLDMVVGNGTVSWQNFGDGTEAIKYFENRGNATSPSFSLTSFTDAMNVGGIYTDTNLAPFMADIDADGDMDMVVGDYAGRYWLYTGQRSSPRDVTVDVGNDGTVDWTSSGVLSGPVTAAGLGSVVHAKVQAGAPGAADAWGNKFVTVRLAVRSAAPGAVTVGGLAVAYDYNGTAADFSSTLNRVRMGTPGDFQGNVQVPLIVTTTSAGQVVLFGLAVTVDLAPTASGPSFFTIQEDTKVDNLVDLTTVFTDDFTPSNLLRFGVTSNSVAGIVEVYISGNRYLGVDAFTGGANDNWNGYVNATLTATDERGLSASFPVTIYVVPVNDVPVILTNTTTVSINEDAPWSFVPGGYDVDGDVLTWSIVGKPNSATFDASSGGIAWTPLQADVGTHSLSFYLSDGVAQAQVQITVVVVNVNDAPFLLPIPNQTALETIPLVIDLRPYFGDEDDDPISLVLQAASGHSTLGGTTLTLLFPKNSGIGAERVRVMVTDPHGATATAMFVVTVIPSGPDLALSGVPDLQVVETVPKTVDLAPYLFNVKDWAALSVTTSSSYAAAAGTKVTFLYPQGYASDTETVKLAVKEGDAMAAWTITVTIVRLGQAILIADLPDLDVAADQETVLELAPYLHNVDAWQQVTLTEDSLYASIEGTTLRLFYPRSAGVTTDAVTVTVAEGNEVSSDLMLVHVRSVGASFYIDAVPPITVVEGQPFVLFLAAFVHNADPLSQVDLFASSPHATVDGLTISFLYPVDGGVANEQVALLARFQSQWFSTVISVNVVSLGGEFTLAGVPNIVVFPGTPYTISLVPYLYNIPGGDIAAVDLHTSSPNTTLGDSLQVTFLYPRDTVATHESVTLTATVLGHTSSQAVTVTIKPLGTRLALAPIPELFLVEDTAFTLDLGPYILNARGQVTVIAESAYATVDGELVTFTYPGGALSDEVIITITAGASSAQGSVRIHVEQRNDAPALVGAPRNFTVEAGTFVSWDFSDIFTDEEDAAGLTYRASDARVQVDNANRRASFVVPGAGEFTFTFTAIDGQNASLTTTSPSVRVTGTGIGGGGGGGVTSPPAEVAFPLVALLLALAGALAVRRLGGAVFGARSDGPTIRRRT